MTLTLTLLMLLGSGDYSNRRAPGFSLADSHYQQHDLQDYRGKVLLIDVMSTGCPTCVRLADVLVKVKEKFGDRLGIVSVLTLPDSYHTAERFAAEHKIAWPIVFDSGQMIMSYLKVTPANPRIGFPHLFVIDANGTIRDDYGESDDKALTFDSLCAAIEKASK